MRNGTPQVRHDFDDATVAELRARIDRAINDALAAARPLFQALEYFSNFDGELAALAAEEELGDRYRDLCKATHFGRLREILYTEAAWCIDAFGVVDGTDLAARTPDDLFEIQHTNKEN